MGINQEIWTRTFAENLFMNNTFMKSIPDHSEYIHYNTVYIPQAGSNPNVVRDRAGLTTPATPYQRADTTLDYDIVQYTTDPIVLTDLEVQYLSADKRSSALKQHMRKLEQVIGNFTCQVIAPTLVTKMVRTSGAASTTALSSGATGSRSAVTLSNIASAKNILDNDNVDQEGRYILMPYSIYNTQFLGINEVAQAQAYGKETLPTGVVAEIHGFSVLSRAQVVSYNTGATPTLKGLDSNGNLSATTSTDNLAILCYHPDFLSQARGSIKVYEHENAPLNYGTIISMGVFHGASKVYSTEIGTAAIIQQ